MKHHILRTWDLVFLLMLALMLFVGGFLLGRNGGADGPPLSDALMQTESSAPATQESAPLLTPLTGSDSTLPPQ